MEPVNLWPLWPLRLQARQNRKRQPHPLTWPVLMGTDSPMHYGSYGKWGHWAGTRTFFWTVASDGVNRLVSV